MKRRCEFIAAKKGHHTQIEALRVVGVSKSSWYRYMGGAKKRAERRTGDQTVTEVARRIWLGSEKAYGVPRITYELKELGYLVNHKRVRRLMRRAGIVSCVPYRPPGTKARPCQPGAEDLVRRDFVVLGPNMVWVTDFTQIKTKRGWLYVCAIVDLFSRAVVGHACGSRCTTRLALDALRNARRKRHPKPGLILHSDHGPQFTSWEYLNTLKRAGIRPSMGTVGAAADNAVMESFWASLKKERLSHWRFGTLQDAEREVRRYISWYNSRRRHSFLGQLAPEAFEARKAA